MPIIQFNKSAGHYERVRCRVHLSGHKNEAYWMEVMEHVYKFNWILLSNPYLKPPARMYLEFSAN